jgi:hypothetical protein
MNKPRGLAEPILPAIVKDDSGIGLLVEVTTQMMMMTLTKAHQEAEEIPTTEGDVMDKEDSEEDHHLHRIHQEEDHWISPQPDILRVKPQETVQTNFMDVLPIPSMATEPR